MYRRLSCTLIRVVLSYKPCGATRRRSSSQLSDTLVVTACVVGAHTTCGTAATAYRFHSWTERARTRDRRRCSDAAGTNPPSPRHERRRAKPRPSTDTGVARGVRCGRRAHLVLIQTTLSQHRSRCLHRPMLSLASAECPRARRARAATRLAARPLRGCA